MELYYLTKGNSGANKTGQKVNVILLRTLSVIEGQGIEDPIPGTESISIRIGLALFQVVSLAEDAPLRPASGSGSVQKSPGVA